MRGWRTLLLSLLPLLSFHGVWGEGFHRYRDFGDRNLYEPPSHNQNVVKDRVDAEFILSKYGYLRCHVTSSRRRRDVGTVEKTAVKIPRAMTNVKMTEEGGGKVCDEKEVDMAIREYQRRYNLSETGRLDEETKSFMSTSRCGNKDEEKDIAEEDSVSLDLHRVDPQPRLNPSKPASRSRLWKRSTTRAGANSKLLNVLTGDPTPWRGIEAHKKHMDEYVERLRKRAAGNRIFLHKYTPKERQKRSVTVRSKNYIGKYVSRNGEFFNKAVVKWRLLSTGYSNRIPVQDQKATIDLAFRMWSEVIPLKFQEDTKSDINDVDIEIAFGRGSHQNCKHDFDGSGGEIAHSWNIGDVHLDDQENFKSSRSYQHDGIYLLRVVVHEIGHVLGLVHTNKTHSIMFAIYSGSYKAPNFELSAGDRREMQSIYGVCKGQFDTVFDWVRRSNDKYIFNTYFFRKDHYWLYENFNNRTRYGDPLYIAREWKGVPNSIDGYVHVWIYHGRKIYNNAYFFKGHLYYEYDSDRDQVSPGWPREISQDFGPKAGQEEGIPNNIDSVFFDPRNRYLYFFKKEDVYVFDPIASGEDKGCCVRKSKIVDEFPAAPDSEPLPSKLDAVYYSYRDKMMYFLKGDELWQNVLFDPRQTRIRNRIQYLGNWQDKWVDICDVEVETDRWDF